MKETAFDKNIHYDLKGEFGDALLKVSTNYVDSLRILDSHLKALYGTEIKRKQVLEDHKNSTDEILTIDDIEEVSEDFILNVHGDGGTDHYLSYLPKEKVAFPLKMNVDDRGSFTELLKTADHGQFSVNISKPGITKGQHWHNSKWEFFIVVSGHGLIQERKIGTDEVLEFEVSGDKIEAVHMLPGYTHNIINLSQDKDLVTVMWANEQYNSEKPDTFFEIVK